MELLSDYINKLQIFLSVILYLVLFFFVFFFFVWLYVFFNSRREKKLFGGQLKSNF